ncbi:MAG: hypothetical protein DHS20C21_01540 [Gemmatimonadota bacterium]|nr:MAG: hypothetical protein DHS20C21_01540 [Gemmatimonadota bacterium]
MTARPLVFLYFALLGTLALAATPVIASDQKDPQEPPFRGEGDLSFFVDLAGFAGAGFTEVEWYVSVSNDQLVFEPGEDSVLTGELLLEVQVSDLDGDRVHTIETTLAPQAGSRLDSSDRAIVQVIRERSELAPGDYHVSVRLIDRRSQKVGLFNRMRNVKNSGELRTWIRVPAIPDTALATSDLTLIRSARAAEGDVVFGRNGVDFDPNPSRYYGLAVPSVRYYLEVYGGPAYEEGDSYLVLSQILDTSGIPLVERKTRTKPLGELLVVTDELNLEGSVSAGRYRVASVVMNERTRQTVRVERGFDVLWSDRSWGLDPDRMHQELALIMTDDEYDTLVDLSPGAREIYLAEFWHGLDPTPDTERNELRETFRERIRTADHQFASALRRGILTDRGRVWVRYGPPDDVDYQYSASGFGPGDGSVRVSEPGERADLGSRPSASFQSAEEFREGDVSGLATQRGGATIKSKQVESWTYDGRGSPLRKDRQDLSQVSHRGLSFLFADQMGNGDYQLIGSQGTSVY